jgi:hypothetical protein
MEDTMFGSKDQPAQGSTRVTGDGDTRPGGTSTDADVTSRMTGTSPAVDDTRPQHAAMTEPGMVGAAAERGDVTGRLHDRDGDGVDDRTEHGRVTNRLHDRDGDGVDDRTEHGGVTNRLHDRDGDGVDDRTETRSITSTRRGTAHAELEAMGVKPAKTSAAAAFALVFGVSALFCGLTGILAPVAVVLGLIGLVLGVAGRKMGRRPGVTGRGVATGGLVTAVLGLLLGLAVIGGIAVYAQQNGLDALQNRIDDARSRLPSGSDVVGTVK